jgi:DNA-binding NtrC family response regulator
MNVMIVDDEPDLCFILDYQVRARGLTPITFKSALDAQKFFETQTAALIICDFQLPQVNGLEFFSWLKERDMNIPFILLTGDSSMDKAPLLNAGMAEILFKPEYLTQLSGLLNKICFP